MTSRIIQILTGAAPGDAITGMALEIQRSLTSRYDIETFALHVDDEIDPEDIKPLIDANKHADLIIYHASYGIPSITKFLLDRDEPIILVYHNITPAKYFVDGNAEFAAGLVWGRYELTLLVPRVVFAIADSKFNAEELARIGYENLSVLKLGLNPNRLCDVELNVDLVARLESQYPAGFVVAVAQVLPHKAIDELVQVAHVLRRWCLSEAGIVVVGTARDERYLHGVVSLLTSMPEVNLWIFGKATESELKTLYHQALAYIGISRHEGLSLPILEAMTEGVPVLVRSAGAVRETAADGAFVLDENATPIEIAEALSLVIESEPLRRHLIERGTRVVEKLDAASDLDSFVDIIESVLQ